MKLLKIFEPNYHFMFSYKHTYQFMFSYKAYIPPDEANKPQILRNLVFESAYRLKVNHNKVS